MNFDDVTNFENLYKAYKRAKQGKGYSQSRLRFEMSALDGILQLKKMLVILSQFKEITYERYDWILWA